MRKREKGHSESIVGFHLDAEVVFHCQIVVDESNCRGVNIGFDLVPWRGRCFSGIQDDQKNGEISSRHSRIREIILKNFKSPSM